MGESEPVILNPNVITSATEDGWRVQDLIAVVVDPETGEAHEEILGSKILGKVAEGVSHQQALRSGEPIDDAALARNLDWLSSQGKIAGPDQKVFYQ